MVEKTEAVLADASERFFVALVQHDAHGYWLQEAGGAEPVAPAAGDIDADVVIVGGGYAGMWTAWHLLDRGARRAAGGRRLRPRPERAQRRLLRDAVVEPAVAARAVRRRARAGRLRGVVRQRARDRRLVRGRGRRRLVPPGRLPDGLDRREARTR